MRLVPESEMSLGEVARVVLGMPVKAKKEVDKKQLAIGILVELEHTDDPKEAEEIARTHLEEDGKYYTKPMKKDWGADEAKDRIKELTKAAQVGAKSFDQIRSEEDPGGKSHDLRLTCIKCGASQTCRCSKPKREFKGLCAVCSSGLTPEEYEQRESDRMKDIFREQGLLGKVASGFSPTNKASLLEAVRAYEPVDIINAFKRLGDETMGQMAPEEIKPELDMCEEWELMDVLRSLGDFWDSDPRQGRLPLNMASGSSPEEDDECICDDITWDEYCSEKCDGPYDEWKKRIDAEKEQMRAQDASRKNASVFVFEDDPDRISIFKKAFGGENVVAISKVADALSILRQGKFSRIYLDRDVSNPKENGEDLAWQMGQERLCSSTPVIIHSENTRGQRVMSKYLRKYHSNVSVIPFKTLKKEFDIPGR
jgi:CheY-like chemotaxis protein